MGIFDYLFDNEFMQRADINSLRDEKRAMTRQLHAEERRSRELQVRVTELEVELEEIQLFSRGILRMLVEFDVCTAEEFSQSLKQVTLEHRQREAAKPATHCPECRHTLQQNNSWCMYCGYRAPTDTAGEEGR